MKQKLWAVALSVVLSLGASVQPIQAAEPTLLEGENRITGWVSVYSGVSASSIDTTQCYAKLTTTAEEGNVALRITYPIDEIPNTTMIVQNYLNDYIEPGEYEIRFRAQGSYDASNSFMTGISPGENWGVESSFPQYYWHRETKEDGWEYFDKKVTITQNMANNNPVFWVQVLRNTDIIIDDVSLTKVGGGKNYIVNPDFNDYKPVTSNIRDWREEYSGSFDQTRVYSEIVDYKASSGKHALRVVFPEQERDYTVYKIYNDLTEPMTAGIYVVEFDIKGVYDSSKIMAGILGAWGNTYKRLGDFSLTSLDNGWVHCRLNVTYDGTSTQAFYFENIAHGDFLLDNVSLVREGTNKNIVANPGFENDALLEAQANMYTADEWIVSCPTVEGRTAFAYPTDVYSYSGNKAMRIVYPGDEIPNMTLQVRNALTQSIPAGTYTMTFYARGNYQVDRIMVGLSGNWNESYSFLNWYWGSGTDIGNGWKRFTRTINASGGNEMLFMILGNADEFIIDNVSLVAQDGTTNYVKNGDFENATPNFELVEGNVQFNVLDENANVIKEDIKTLESGKIQAVVNLKNYGVEDKKVKVYIARFKNNRLDMVNSIGNGVLSEADWLLPADTFKVTMDVPEFGEDSYKLAVFAWNSEMAPFLEGQFI